MAEQENVNVQEVNAQDAQEEKVFSHSEVDAMFNKKFAKLAEKHKAEMEKAVADAVAQVEEAHKVAQMGEKERQAHEYEAMEKKLQALEAEKQHNTMVAEARKLFDSNNIKGMPDSVIGMIVSSDPGETATAVNDLSAFLQKWHDEDIRATLADTEPRRGSAPGMTKEEILAIKDKSTRLKAIEDNIELFQGGN